MRLDLYDATDFDRGASRAPEAVWLLISGLLVSTFLPGSAWRVALLRLFGARIGSGVVVKPGVRVKFPWRLVVGDHCWIGEHVWIDNLAPVTLGDHVCISQAAYLCTGDHDWASETFDLMEKPIFVESHAWIGAKSVLGPGCRVREGAVVTLGGIANGELEAWTIHSGSPARPVKKRARATVGASTQDAE